MKIYISPASLLIPLFFAAVTIPVRAASPKSERQGVAVMKDKAPKASQKKTRSADFSPEATEGLVRSLVKMGSANAKQTLQILEKVQDKETADAAATEELKVLRLVSDEVTGMMMAMGDSGLIRAGLLKELTTQEDKQARTELVKVGKNLKRNNYYGSELLQNALKGGSLSMQNGDMTEEDAALCAYYKKVAEQRAAVGSEDADGGAVEEIARRVKEIKRCHTIPTTGLSEEYQRIESAVRRAESAYCSQLEQLLRDVEAGRIKENDIGKRCILITVSCELKLCQIQLKHPHFALLREYALEYSSEE